MLAELSEGLYAVQLYARVIDRDTKEVLIEDSIFTTREAPTFHYYTGNARLLRNQILHQARVRYVYYLKMKIGKDTVLRRMLKRRDWMVDVVDLRCVITPDPTEEHREKLHTLMSGGIFNDDTPQKKAA